MKKIQIFIFIYTVVLSADNFAQELQPRQKYFTFGFNYSPFGVGFSSKISGDGKQMHRTPDFIAGKSGRGGNVALAGFTSMGVNTSFLWKDKHGKNFTAISLEFQQNRASYSFNQPLSYSYTATRRGGDGDADDPMVTDTLRHIDKWIDMDRYLKGAIAIQRFWLITDGYFDEDNVYSYLKLSFGQSFLHRSMGHLIKTGDAETYGDNHGNYISATTTSVNPKSYMLGAEVGIRVLTAEGKNSFDIGAGCCFALNSTYTRNYSFYDSSPGTAPPVGNSSYRFSGGSVYLNISYSFNSRIKSKPPDTLMHEEKYQEKPQPMAHVHKPHHLNGRRVHINDEIDSDEETLTIQVYDKGKVDGDRISLYLNGELLLEDYTVGKVKKELTLHLKPGENYLVMHALNLGRIPPNTAAIRIFKNGKPKDIILNSDMSKSGGLKINYKGENG